MQLVLEPVYDEVLEAQAEATGVRLLGLEATRRLGAWPTLRHVFDLGEDAGLHLEVGPYDGCEVFAVGYSMAGDELLTAL